MKKNISEKELSTISGGKTKNLTMVYQSKGFVKKLVNWFKH
ncbi:bacteriocin [Lactobacillus halodurans]|uniref:Bacteriocin n=1 Tax=Companilactobacillus halodurans TaxID=2584183 RepID=A0A5P0ZS84_9LACO|nr:bacteriocin [Companilactobacillus halodurans]MQS77097.1 bacteriocin [Companilactobacillus halodurans]